MSDPQGAARTQHGKDRRTAVDQARWQPHDGTRLPSSSAGAPPTLLSTRAGDGVSDPACYRPGRVPERSRRTSEDDRPAAREKERPNLDRERQRKGGRRERREKTPEEGADIPRPTPRANPYAPEIKRRTRTQWYSACRGERRDTATGGDANQDGDAHTAVARDSNARRTKRTIAGCVSKWSTTGDPGRVTS